MPIPFTCEECGQSGTADDSSAGQVVLCSRCHAILVLEPIQAMCQEINLELGDSMPITVDLDRESKQIKNHKSHPELNHRLMGCLGIIMISFFLYLLPNPVTGIISEIFNYVVRIAVVVGILSLVTIVFWFLVVKIAEAKKRREEAERNRIREREEKERRERVRLTQRGYWLDLTGHQVEREFAKLLQDLGYSATATRGAGDGGVDIFAKKDGREIVIQCKHWKGRVGPSPVRELNGVRRGADAWMMASSGLTKEGYKEAREFGIRVLTLEDVLDMAENARDQSDC